MFGEEHGQGVGFFAGRTSGAPDADSPGAQSLFGFGAPTGKYVLHHEIELAGFAEESGFVGGDGVDHAGAFFLLVRVRNALVVNLQGSDIELAKAAEETSAEQGGF